MSRFKESVESVLERHENQLKKFMYTKSFSTLQLLKAQKILELSTNTNKLDSMGCPQDAQKPISVTRSQLKQYIVQAQSQQNDKSQQLLLLESSPIYKSHINRFFQPAGGCNANSQNLPKGFQGLLLEQQPLKSSNKAKPELWAPVPPGQNLVKARLTLISEDESQAMNLNQHKELTKQQFSDLKFKKLTHNPQSASVDKLNNPPNSQQVSLFSFTANSNAVIDAEVCVYNKIPQFATIDDFNVQEILKNTGGQKWLKRKKKSIALSQGPQPQTVTPNGPQHPNQFSQPKCKTQGQRRDNQTCESLIHNQSNELVSDHFRTHIPTEPHSSYKKQGEIISPQTQDNFHASQAELQEQLSAEQLQQLGSPSEYKLIKNQSFINLFNRLHLQKAWEKKKMKILRIAEIKYQR